MTNDKQKFIDKAKEILRGSESLDSNELFELCKQLETYDQFSYASEILLKKIELDERTGKFIPLKEFQTLAQYIYKDQSLPSSLKYDLAFQKLNSHDSLTSTSDCETLGLAGAIYKMRWKYDHQFKNLIISRYYFKRGYELWKGDIALKSNLSAQHDEGYTAINFAYLNDLMAVDKLEEHGAITGLSESIFQRIEEAYAVRNFIIEQFVSDTNYKELKFEHPHPWIYATVAEAYFGIRKYDEALFYIKTYFKIIENKAWEIRTFSKQLYSLAYLQSYMKEFSEKHPSSSVDEPKFKLICNELNIAKINECLQLIISLEDDIEISSKESTVPKNVELNRGKKTGLALSGGGLRASLFHIGVLSALAEKDELRHLEVISCVSGGSIIGAFYYLKIVELFERKPDEEITKADYIQVMQEVVAEFTASIQCNLRMQIFLNLPSNIKMLYDKNYSRTHRLGELYEKKLYLPTFLKIQKNRIEKRRAQTTDEQELKKIEKDAKRTFIFMDDLKIYPPDKKFNFLQDNWKRINKIPQLVLNATSVNTGHNWQFTASWMGEPPANIDHDIDMKARLRRMYYNDAPDGYKRFRLGYAVAASSCVPVMFQPLPMNNLYEGINLQLIDGGLHDNQGIGSLIEQECNAMIISDGSAQLPITIDESKNELALFYRSDNILQERLRELQFMDITERNQTSQIHTLVKVHLKNDLEPLPINWINCTDAPRSLTNTIDAQHDNDLTKYGIIRKVQKQLSEIRTDLDSFHESESYALMYSGYRQIKYEYKHQELEEGKSSSVSWDFVSKIKIATEEPKAASKLNVLLEVSKELTFKPFRLNKALLIPIVLLAVILVLLCYPLISEHWNDVLFGIKPKYASYLVGFLALGALLKIISSMINYPINLRKMAISVLIVLFGSIVCGLYLATLNKWYTHLGKLKKGDAVED